MDLQEWQQWLLLRLLLNLLLAIDQVAPKSGDLYKMVEVQAYTVLASSRSEFHVENISALYSNDKGLRSTKVHVVPEFT